MFKPPFQGSNAVVVPSGHDHDSQHDQRWLQITNIEGVLISQVHSFELFINKPVNIAEHPCFA